MTDQPPDIDSQLRPAPPPTDPNTGETVLGAVVLMLAFLAVVGGLVVWGWLNSIQGHPL